jgi:hypothetical protein
MRPAGLSSGIDQDRADYTVFCGEWNIGRIYQTRGGPDGLRWFWSLTVKFHRGYDVLCHRWIGTRERGDYGKNVFHDSFLAAPIHAPMLV